MPVNPFSSPSSSANHHYGDFTAEELRPFRRLEILHSDLFSSSAITELNEGDTVGIPPSKIKDVDLDECEAINTSCGRQKAIGTLGVSSCIAICARGENRNRETILGLYHYGGDAVCSTREALAQLRQTMNAKGAVNPKVYLIGGMISKDPYLCTNRVESSLLSLRSQYNIQGARLHINESEIMDDNASASVLLTPSHTYFMRHENIYEQ